MSDDENLHVPEGPRYRFDDTETIILNAALQREDGMVLPIPESITANPERVRRKLKRLIKAGLIEEVPAKLEDGLWRKDKDDRHLTLELTTEGRRAAHKVFDEGPGITQSEEADHSKSRSAGAEADKRDTQPARRPRKPRGPATGVETLKASKSADKAKGTRESAASKSSRSNAKKARAPRQNKSHDHAKESKGAQLLAALGRVKGATLEELMKLSGWQAHSVRGFLSGTVKKKLKLKLRTEVDGRGVRRYQIPPPRKKA